METPHSSLLTPHLQAGWLGSLALEFNYDSQGTHLNHCRVQAPLKVQRPFYPEGAEVCHGVMLHTAGGVVGGDRLSFNIHLHPQAQALLTTAAAAKLYRSTGAEAQQTVCLTVDAGACLEWLPQETIVFNGANYRQETRIELAENALWMGWDMTRFGRSARGERFLEGTWRSHTEVWQQGRPLWIDRQWLPGGSSRIESPHGLGGCPVVGSFALVGRSVSPEVVEQARSLWISNAEAEIGVTRLMSGLLCRYRGRSTVEARRWFTAVWDLVRQSYLERPACPPRVWPL